MVFGRERSRKTSEFGRCKRERVTRDRRLNNAIFKKEQQFSRVVILLVIATTRARGIPTTPSQRRRLRFRDADREKLCPTSLAEREKNMKTREPKYLSNVLIPFLKFNCIQTVQH
jgi:hypothetical protein